MAASKLTLYNGALALLKERPLASLAENREPRRILDSAWDRGAIKACLGEGNWKHASKAVMLDASPSIAPDFGYDYGFDKPSDFVRIIGVWSDEGMQQPFSDYREEAGFWFGSLETMYVKYVSDSTDYGMDYSLWPQSFIEFVEAHLAYKVAGPMTEQGREVFELRNVLLEQALSKDAINEPTKYPPAGSWVRARLGGLFGRPRWREGRWT